MSAAAGASTVSSPATIDVQELLSVCVDLATHAGEAIRSIFDSGKLEAIDKEAAAGEAGKGAEFIIDPQTAADLESQRIIIGNLQRLYGPALRIVGEEGELDNAAGPAGARECTVRRDGLASSSFPAELRAVPIADLTLWIDPLDGTKEFVIGFVHYVTVLIGVSIRGRAVAGVIHVPFCGGKYVRKVDPLNPVSAAQAALDAKAALSPPGQTIWGCVGVGVQGLERLPASSVPEGRKVVTTTRTHFSPALSALLDVMKPDAVVRCGGAGSKGLLVMNREVDAYVYPQGGTKRWDTCAIDACTKALGGTFTDQFGDEIIYDPDAKHDNDKGLLATLTNHQLYVLPKPAAQASEDAKKANL